MRVSNARAALAALSTVGGRTTITEGKLKAAEDICAPPNLPGTCSARVPKIDPPLMEVGVVQHAVKFVENLFGVLWVFSVHPLEILNDRQVGSLMEFV